MDKLFLVILNMSLTGVFVIAAICIARLPLKKAPKLISYCLWAVAGFRLVFPFSIESFFSLIPFKAQTIPPDIAMQPIPRIDSGIPFVNNVVSSVLPAATPATSDNPLQIWTAIGTWVWIIGVVVMFIYGMVSFIILKRKMSKATHVEANICEAANIKSPFVLGVFKPRIYLPIGLSEQERSYIILHEQTHIKRCDHIIKFVAYIVLCLHWFNPLVWVAFLLMGVDMEMSCDERVLKEMGSETKKDYSLSLLSLATERRFVGGNPLAFGEGGIKERVKNVLKFKQPSMAILIASVAFVAVLSVGFAVNKISDATNAANWGTYNFPGENYNHVFFECNDTPYNPEYNFISAQLMNNQNIQGLTCGKYFTVVMQVGDLWKIVPFKDSTEFEDTAWLLGNGSSIRYNIKPDMLAVKLNEGQYRIITEIYHADIAGETPIKHVVWAEFTIDRNAPKQDIYITPAEWFGNFYGKEMTLNDLRKIVKTIPELTLKELLEYRCINVSSSLFNYNMLFSTESGSLQIYANSEYVISQMTFKIKEAEAPLDLLTEPERLDDYINGKYQKLAN